MMVVIMALLLCCSFIACSGQPETTTNGSTESAESGDLEPGVNGEVVVSHWGGTTSDAYHACYWDDFEKETGIKVVEVLATNNKSQLQAMVDTNSVDVDLMQGAELELNYFKDREKETGKKYIADIDFSLLPADEVAALTTDFPNAVGAFAYASVIAYSTDAFTEDNHPSSWADFWDVEKYPGKRTIVSGASGDYPPLEYALLADGVPIDELYPLDVERAFKKLDELKPNVLKFWMSGSEAPQMLIDGEVTVAEGFSGRFATIKDQGAHVAIEYNQGGLNYDLFFIPEGAPNYENAHKLLSYMVQAERQAKFAKMTNYAPDNQNAYNYLDPEFAATLVTAPGNYEKMFTVNNKYWADNMLEIQDKWLAWEGNQ
jgi:putative spermidine/putrescine transport system substrate-binding protein